MPFFLLLFYFLLPVDPMTITMTTNYHCHCYIDCLCDYSYSYSPVSSLSAVCSSSYSPSIYVHTSSSCYAYCYSQHSVCSYDHYCHYWSSSSSSSAVFLSLSSHVCSWFGLVSASMSQRKSVVERSPLSYRSALCVENRAYIVVQV